MKSSSFTSKKKKKQNKTKKTKNQIKYKKQSSNWRIYFGFELKTFEKSSKVKSLRDNLPKKSIH
jgi:hypothetical protein